MTEMTSHERFKCMYEHRAADRVPIIDKTWPSTRKRWRKELTAGGGLIFSSDHSIPDDVPLANYRRIAELAKELGALLIAGAGDSLEVGLEPKTRNPNLDTCLPAGRSEANLKHECAK